MKYRNWQSSILEASLYVSTFWATSLAFATLSYGRMLSQMSRLFGSSATPTGGRGKGTESERPSQE